MKRYARSFANLASTLRLYARPSVARRCAKRLMSPSGLKNNFRTKRNMFIVTCSIGLLHGLGFSFVLHKILQITSPDIWQTLLAFNVGVEIGQLSIILATWPVFRLIQRSSENAWRIGRIGLATTCMAIAAVWTWQRVMSVIGTL